MQPEERESLPTRRSSVVEANKAHLVRVLTPRFEGVANGEQGSCMEANKAHPVSVLTPRFENKAESATSSREGYGRGGGERGREGPVQAASGGAHDGEICLQVSFVPMLGLLRCRDLFTGRRRIVTLDPRRCHLYAHARKGFRRRARPMASGVHRRRRRRRGRGRRKRRRRRSI